MSTLIPVEVIAEALAKHLMYEDGSCSGCPFRVDDGQFDIWEVQFAAHQASVIAALPDITIVPGENKRRYSAAYRNADGQVVPVGVDYSKRAWAEEVRDEWRRDDPTLDVFIAYRDVPEWSEVEEHRRTNECRWCNKVIVRRDGQWRHLYHNRSECSPVVHGPNGEHKTAEPFSRAAAGGES